MAPVSVDKSPVFGELRGWYLGDRPCYGLEALCDVLAFPTFIGIEDYSPSRPKYLRVQAAQIYDGSCHLTAACRCTKVALAVAASLTAILHSAPEAPIIRKLTPIRMW